MSKIVLFGDSHSRAIKDAVRSRIADGHRVQVEVLQRLKLKGIAKAASDGSEPVSPEGMHVGDTSFEAFIQRLAAFKPSAVVASFIGGNTYAGFSTIQHPQPFDFLIPGDSPNELALDAEIIPFRMIYDQFARMIYKGDGASLMALRKATKATIVHLLAPPPKYDNHFITENYDTRYAADGIASLGVSQPHLRMKFWRLQNIAIQGLCAEIGIEVLGPPSEALDGSGFLARPYWARDATHANADYGELVLKQLEVCFLQADQATSAGTGDRRAQVAPSVRSSGRVLADFIPEFYGLKQVHSRKRRANMASTQTNGEGTAQSKQRKFFKDLASKPGVLESYNIKIGGKIGDERIKIVLEQKASKKTGG